MGSADKIIISEVDDSSEECSSLCNSTAMGVSTKISDEECSSTWDSTKGISCKISSPLSEWDSDSDSCSEISTLTLTAGVSKRSPISSEWLLAASSGFSEELLALTAPFTISLSAAP